MGQRADALKVIERLKASGQERYVPPCRVALIYASLGENKQALDWLEKAYAKQDWFLWYLNVEPAYKDLRSEPRFAELLRKVGLADKAAKKDQVTHSVAVLPFQNLGGDPKTEFLSDGVAEQIINNLSQVRRKDLIVRPFTSVARYRGKELDIQKFGRELKVQMIVTGTLRQNGDRLSISVEVVDVEQDSQIWGHRYPDKPRDAILDLQDKIARDVAARLRLELTGEEDKRLTKRYTHDSEAYLLYREGVYHWNKFSPEGLKTAKEYFQQALLKDPNYALAETGLGQYYLLQGNLYEGPKQTFPEAKRHLNKALDNDSSLAETHAQLGAVYLFEWNWTAAKSELERAIDLDPNLPAQSLYGFYLGAMGRPAEALAFFRRARELDPFAAPRRAHITLGHLWLQEYDDAIAEAQKALALDANFLLSSRDLAVAYSLKGMHEQAIAELQSADKISKNHTRIRGFLGYAYAKAGRTVEARKVLEELNGLSKQYGYASAIARIHTALGEKDQAFEWLRKACCEQDPQVIWIKVDPTLDNLRKDLRFAQVLKEMGLPP
jgi:serine/threonine-protein kinase